MNNIKKAYEKQRSSDGISRVYQNIYTHIVAIKERVEGNESVGTMWADVKTFHKDTPINEILEWAQDVDGKLYITVDESTIDKKS